MGEPAQRQYCLKWNNHPRNVATVFDRLRAEELFVDVTLATADRQVIRAHRVLLSAGSGYLERLLAVTPSDHPTVVLSNIKYKELKLLVDFMYSGEIAVGQAQFPGLMESANWLQVRGLCTEELKEEREESEEEAELTVTANGRKRRHSGESEQQQEEQEEPEEEEEEEEPILGPEEEMGEQAAKQRRQMYSSPIQGVANAVWMMQPENKGAREEESMEEGRGPEPVPDLVTVSGTAVTAPVPHPKAHLINPASLNEQLLQAMQLCSNPYLNPMAAMQKRPSLDHVSPNSSFSSFPPSPFKASCPGSPAKASMLVTSAPVRRYKQYTEDSLQAALKEIMNGQSINRSSMKHAIPARTLRDWMKRLNIKSVFTHPRGGGSQAGEEESLAGSSPEPLASPTFGLSPSSLSLIRAGFSAQRDAEEDAEEDTGEGSLRIDEGGPGVQPAMQQIAQAAN